MAFNLCNYEVVWSSLFTWTHNFIEWSTFLHMHWKADFMQSIILIHYPNCIWWSCDTDDQIHWRYVDLQVDTNISEKHATEDGGSMFPRYVGTHVQVHMTSQHRWPPGRTSNLTITIVFFLERQKI
jgi:hypothetical protein